MTSLEQCFMLDKSLRLTFQTMLAIYKSGFTRIPVFEGERQNIVAVLYAKDLILLDPDDSIEIGTVLSFRSALLKARHGFGNAPCFKPGLPKSLHSSGRGSSFS